LPKYDYLCKSGHLTERINGYDVDTIECPVCGEEAKRQSVYAFTPFTETGVKVGRLGPVPREEKRYDVSLFQEASEERDYNHKKAEEAAGRPLKSKNLWGEAKKQANAILAGKAPPRQAQTRFSRKRV